jgi:hypothetical protein
MGLRPASDNFSLNRPRPLPTDKSHAARMLLGRNLRRGKVSIEFRFVEEKFRPKMTLHSLPLPCCWSPPCPSPPPNFNSVIRRSSTYRKYLNNISFVNYCWKNSAIEFVEQKLHIRLSIIQVRISCLVIGS